jgi:hypothetical protein
LGNLVCLDLEPKCKKTCLDKTSTSPIKTAHSFTKILEKTIEQPTSKEKSLDVMAIVAIIEAGPELTKLAQKSSKKSHKGKRLSKSYWTADWMVTFFPRERNTQILPLLGKAGT